MSAPADRLREKIAAFLAWEKRKRWEFILAALVCYALAGALALMLLGSLLPIGIAPPWIFLGLVFLFAPIVILPRRWNSQDETRALVQLDKSLRLDERAVTAWEALQRGETRAAALLVIKQAGDKLGTFNPRELLPRRPSWQAYSVLPLLAFCLALLWFDFGTPKTSDGLRAPQTMAQKLKEFARELQEKAKSDGLKESLQAGQELEKLAQQGLDKKSGDEQVKKAIAGAAQKLADAGKQAAERASLATAQSEQSLRDLKAELEAARDLFNTSGAAQETRAQDGSWLDRLASLPQLKRQLDKEARGGQPMGEREMKSFLDKMDRQVTAELDRRTLLDAEQFLQQMMKQGQGERGETNARAAGREQQGAADDGEKGPSQSNLPGSEPGKKSGGEAALPQFSAAASTQIKGMLGAGASSAMVFKGKPAAGKSALSQQEIFSSYRRQAEEDLSSERVPEALKETIRNYFMSLEEGKR